MNTVKHLYSDYCRAAEQSALADNTPDETFFEVLEAGRIRMIDAAICLARCPAQDLADVASKAAVLTHLTVAPWNGQRLEVARSVMAYALEGDLLRLGIALPRHTFFDDDDLPGGEPSDGRADIEEAALEEVADAARVAQ